MDRSSFGCYQLAPDLPLSRLHNTQMAGGNVR
jgi:hypothetical protein